MTIHHTHRYRTTGRSGRLAALLLFVAVLAAACGGSEEIASEHPLLESLEPGGNEFARTGDEYRPPTYDLEAGTYASAVLPVALEVDLDGAVGFQHVSPAKVSLAPNGRLLGDPLRTITIASPAKGFRVADQLSDVRIIPNPATAVPLTTDALVEYVDGAPSLERLDAGEDLLLGSTAPWIEVALTGDDVNTENCRRACVSPFWIGQEAADWVVLEGTVQRWYVVDTAEGPLVVAIEAEAQEFDAWLDRALEILDGVTLG